MLVEIKDKNSSGKMLNYIDSSCLISIEIIDVEKRNERSAVKKYSFSDGAHIPYILEGKTINNIFVNDQIIKNGISTYSFDSELVHLDFGTESECIDRLENLQSSLNWIKAENSNNIRPFGSYINPSHIMHLKMYESLNSHMHGPNTHHINCILKHRYISAIEDFIPLIYATQIGRDLKKFIKNLMDDPSQNIVEYIMFIQSKLESIIKYKEFHLFTGDKTQCETKLIEIRDLLNK